MKLFIVPAHGIDCPFYLLTENGECLASHFCSYEGFAKRDLHDDRPERIEEFKQRFGEYTVQFIDEQDEITQEQLVELNQNLKP